MSGLATVMELMESLVHPDARAFDRDRSVHRDFIATRLGVSLAALATSAIGFASGHVPAPWEALALAWLMLPLVAAMVLSRTGRLLFARTLGPVTWVGLAATACWGGGLSGVGACALLLLVAVETAGAPGAGPTGLATVGVGILLGFGALLTGVLPGHGAFDLPVTSAAVAYGLVVAVIAANGHDRLARERSAADRLARAVADLSGDLILTCDRGGTVLDVGRTATECHFGLTSRDLLGRATFERVHVADRPAFLTALGTAAAAGTVATALVRLRTAVVDGGRPQFREPVFTWMDLRVRRRDGADPIQLVALLRDASTRTRQDAQEEAAADRLRRDAERAGAWKDTFIAKVSHELRTPLNAVIGFSEILANPSLAPGDPDKRQDYARIIATSGQHLLSVVNSLLDLSKIDAGRFELLPDAFDLPALIQACCDMVTLQAEQAGVALDHERRGGPLDLVGDARACRQIVINLVSNALKFTGAGGRVSIGARLQGSGVVIAVTDTGVGIPDADLRRVGDAFFQGKAGGGRAFEGTGLGLSVVRGLVGVHGGRITIESAVGEGTRVQVYLPLDCRTVKTGGTAATIDVVPRSARDVGIQPSELVRMQKRA